MPRMNQQGPEGKGPGTGRKLGRCAEKIDAKKLGKGLGKRFHAKTEGTGKGLRKNYFLKKEEKDTGSVK